MANEVKNVNGVAITNIKNINAQTDANIKKFNGQEFTGTVDPSFTTAYTDVEFSGSAIDDDRNGEVVSCYDPDNNFVYVQYSDSGGGGTAVVGAFNSSANDIDFGAKQAIEGSNAFSGNSCDYDTKYNKVWTTWIGGSGNQLFCRVGTIAADKSIEWGDRITIQEGYSTHSAYNQGLLGMGIAVDQETGAALIVWNNPTDSISGSSNAASSHHPNGVIVTLDDTTASSGDSDFNDITAGTPARLFTGNADNNFPMVKVIYDPDNEEWVCISDANNGSGASIEACRVTNSSGTPAAANVTTLGSNSGHTLQGVEHNATVGVTGRYAANTFCYDSNNDVFIVGSAASSPKLFAFENTGSGITWDTTGQAISCGTVLSQSGKGGGVQFNHHRNRIMVWGSDNSDITMELLTYGGSGSWTSINSGSLIEIIDDATGFFKSGSPMVKLQQADGTNFAGSASLLTGLKYSSLDAKYCLFDPGG